ncbi:hypothetical protein B0H14DRAFT_2592156, partial [Mycena olivaceomarginata]
DLTGALRAFFSSVCNYVAVCGEEVFQQEFKSTLPNVTTRGQINAIIHAYNHYHAPKTAHLPLKPYKFSDDEKTDTSPSKSPVKRVVLKVTDKEAGEKEDGEVDEDAEGEEDATAEQEPESSKSFPHKKHKRTPRRRSRLCEVGVIVLAVSATNPGGDGKGKPICIVLHLNVRRLPLLESIALALLAWDLSLFRCLDERGRAGGGSTEPEEGRGITGQSLMVGSHGLLLQDSILKACLNVEVNFDRDAKVKGGELLARSKVPSGKGWS